MTPQAQKYDASAPPERVRVPRVVVALEVFRRDDGAGRRCGDSGGNEAVCHRVGEGGRECVGRAASVDEDADRRRVRVVRVRCRDELRMRLEPVVGVQVRMFEVRGIG